MIKPVQRITRYPLLLKELKHNTSPENRDYEKLNEAIEKVTDLVGFINEKKRNVERRAELPKIAESISKIPPRLKLVQPNRFVIREGVMKIGKKYRKYWLFNDSFLYAKKMPFGKSVFKGCIFFDKALCKDILSNL